MIDDQHDVSELLRSGHPNVLIIGSDRLTNEVIDRLRPLLPLPLHTCELPGRLVLPTAGGGTLLLRHVAELGREQQSQLLQWLDNHDGDVQVVCVSSTPLFSFVERGAFDKSLYYRLNTVCEEVDATR